MSSAASAGGLDGLEALDVGGVAFRVAGGGRARLRPASRARSRTGTRPRRRGRRRRPGRRTRGCRAESRASASSVPSSRAISPRSTRRRWMSTRSRASSRGVGAQLQPVRHGGAPGEHGLLDGGLGDRVEVFEGFDRRAARVGAERDGHQPGALLSGLDPAHPLAERGGEALGVCSLRDLGQRRRQGRADAWRPRPAGLAVVTSCPACPCGCRAARARGRRPTSRSGSARRGRGTPPGASPRGRARPSC